jgi:hypothetical protein
MGQRRPVAPVLCWLGPVLAHASACVPEGPPTAREGTVVSDFLPNEGAAADDASTEELIVEPFRDDFDRATLGDDWNALSDAWVLRDGKLCAQGAKNRGVWLKKRLPTNARIEVDATALSPEGDLKVELWGDGRSGATGASYSDATSYVAIFGGWNNALHVLARLDEHGEDRLTVDVEPGSDDERARAVEPGQPYRFVFERRQGNILSWTVNGLSYFELLDEEPLVGPGHEHLGFNDWNASVCFDNLLITPR